MMMMMIYLISYLQPKAEQWQKFYKTEKLFPKI